MKKNLEHRTAFPWEPIGRVPAPKGLWEGFLPPGPILRREGAGALEQIFGEPRCTELHREWSLAGASEGAWWEPSMESGPWDSHQNPLG